MTPDQQALLNLMADTLLALGVAAIVGGCAIAFWQ